MQDELNKLTQQLSKLFDNQIASDTEQHVHQLVQSYIQKMGFVSREEFDAQSAVLQRSREKLKQLEQRLDTIERNR
ncbi:MAG: accessory factor UbiK family protein [Gammaproteobacteria bacterium]|nr:accessory factor UbiK family protein [Gammaproteobacteria bacterium]